MEGGAVGAAGRATRPDDAARRRWPATRPARRRDHSASRRCGHRRSSSSRVGGWLTRAAERELAGVRHHPEITSIVVLPLENLSTDPAQEFFAAGLTEEITARLAQLTKLRVVSRTSAMSLKDRKLPVSAIARELDIDAVVEGSVRREAGRVRISIQLIHARNGHAPVGA